MDPCEGSPRNAIGLKFICQSGVAYLFEGFAEVHHESILLMSPMTVSSKVGMVNDVFGNNVLEQLAANTCKTY